MKYGGTGVLFAVVGENPQCRKTVPLLLLALMLTLSCSCTTHSHVRDDGAMITVKKFVGIPYLEREERTITRPEGSEYRLVQ
jgi:hypothetical protein